MTQVFISYRHDDEMATMMHQKLYEHFDSVHVFLDTEILHPTQNWLTQIMDALSSSIYLCIQSTPITDTFLNYSYGMSGIGQTLCRRFDYLSHRLKSYVLGMDNPFSRIGWKYPMHTWIPTNLWNTLEPVTLSNNQFVCSNSALAAVTDLTCQRYSKQDNIYSEQVLNDTKQPENDVDGENKPSDSPNTSQHNIPTGTRMMLATLDRNIGLFTSDQSESDASDVQKIGDQIKSKRKHLGYKREVLSQLINVDMAALVAVENGMGDKSTAEAILDKMNNLK